MADFFHGLRVAGFGVGGRWIAENGGDPLMRFPAGNLMVSSRFILQPT